MLMIRRVSQVAKAHGWRHDYVLMTAMYVLSLTVQARENDAEAKKDAEEESHGVLRGALKKSQELKG